MSEITEASTKSVLEVRELSNILEKERTRGDMSITFKFLDPLVGRDLPKQNKIASH